MNETKGLSESKPILTYLNNIIDDVVEMQNIAYEMGFSMNRLRNPEPSPTAVDKLSEKDIPWEEKTIEQKLDSISRLSTLLRQTTSANLQRLNKLI